MVDLGLLRRWSSFLPGLAYRGENEFYCFTWRAVFSTFENLFGSLSFSTVEWFVNLINFFEEVVVGDSYVILAAF